MTLLYAVGMLLGISLAVTCKDGPFNLFKKIRSFGKPFTCSFCMTIWSMALVPSFLYLPEIVLVMVSAPGYGMITLHILGIHQLFEIRNER